MKYLVLESAAAAQAREVELSTATGYPRQATATQRVVEALSHADGRGALPVPAAVWSWASNSKVDLASLLTDSERVAQYTSAEMRADGWWPQQEMP